MNMDDLYRLLRADHVQAKGIVDTVADPLLVLDRNLCVQNASRVFCETFKVHRDEMIGRPVYELGDGQWDIPDLRRLLADVIPKASAVINYEVEHVFPHLGRRVMLLTARTLFHPDGAGTTMLLSFVDATDRHRRDLAREMMFGELRHRMKNLLGIAQSIARQTDTEGLSAEDYRDAFLGRFNALIEAENLAFADHEAVGLKQLIERIMSPYEGAPDAAIAILGEPVDLGPRILMSLGLVLHELATNAAKYGGLSNPGGQVEVRWQVEDDGRTLRLSWTETGGPPVTPPTKSGYGSKLIGSTVAYNLRGEIDQDYAPDGLRLTITIPTGTAPASSG